MSNLSRFFSGKLLPVVCFVVGALLDEAAVRIGYPELLCVAAFALVVVSAATGAARFQNKTLRYVWVFINLAGASNIGSHFQHGWILSSVLLVISAVKIYTSKDDTIVRMVCTALCVILAASLAVTGMSGKDNMAAASKADNEQQAAETFSDTTEATTSTTGQNNSSRTKLLGTCTFCGGSKMCDHCILGECEHCDGEGSTWCENCFGSGDCSSCYGLGGEKVYKVGKGVVWVDCSRCRGSGICKRCDSGRIPCRYCNSSGQCAYCKGTGDCPYCYGR